MQPHWTPPGKGPYSRNRQKCDHLKSCRHHKQRKGGNTTTTNSEHANQNKIKDSHSYWLILCFSSGQQKIGAMWRVSILIKLSRCLILPPFLVRSSCFWWVDSASEASLFTINPQRQDLISLDFRFPLTSEINVWFHFKMFFPPNKEKLGIRWIYYPKPRMPVAS